VVRQAVALAATGAVAGTAFAIAGARFLASLLEGVSAYDPITFAAAPVAAVVIAVLAAVPPAVRAARTDPMRTLRGD
jgi:ABC-type antimicrobial peptide transport system permease subunit